MLVALYRISVLTALLPLVVTTFPTPMLVLVNLAPEEIPAREAQIAVEEVADSSQSERPRFRPGITALQGLLQPQNPPAGPPQLHAGRPSEGHRLSNGLNAPFLC